MVYLWCIYWGTGPIAFCASSVNSLAIVYYRYIKTWSLLLLSISLAKYFRFHSWVPILKDKRVRSANFFFLSLNLFRLRTLLKIEFILLTIFFIMLYNLLKLAVQSEQMKIISISLWSFVLLFFYLMIINVKIVILGIQNKIFKIVMQIMR